MISIGCVYQYDTIMKKFLGMLMIAVMCFGVVSSSYAAHVPQTKHLKKDGTRDKRYKENKTPVHLKKDGTLQRDQEENQLIEKACLTGFFNLFQLLNHLLCKARLITWALELTCNLS
jgi:hypothetical protein